MQERVHVPPETDAVPRTYVECMTGAATKPFGIYAARARRRGWDTRTLDAGHEVMIAGVVRARPGRESSRNPGTIPPSSWFGTTPAQIRRWILPARAPGSG